MKVVFEKQPVTPTRIELTIGDDINVGGYEGKFAGYYETGIGYNNERHIVVHHHYAKSPNKVGIFRTADIRSINSVDVQGSGWKLMEEN